jgi:hypothetical protein
MSGAVSSQAWARAGSRPSTPPTGSRSPLDLTDLDPLELIAYQVKSQVA